VDYLFGLIIVGILFLAMHHFTELTKSQKFIVSILLLITILGAIAYNTYKTQQRTKMLAAVTKFNQGKTIKCNGVDVNSSVYSLSVGTYTFIGKENRPHYTEMINAFTCQ